MASLSDLTDLYAPEAPAGFNLANIALQRSSGQAAYDMARNRVMRDFGQFDLPDILSAQAARGALASGATRRKVNRAATGVSDTLANLGIGYAPNQSRLATNALLAQTGISLGDLV